MKRSCLFVVLLFLAASALAGGGGDFRTNPQPIPSQYIVVLESWVSDVSAVASSIALENGVAVEHVYEHALKGFSAQMTEAQAKALTFHPLVQWVEEDGVMEISETQINPPWGLDRIDQRNLPFDSAYTYNSTGSGVKVYVIDTGIRRTHTDFGGRAVSGFTAINDGRGTTDCNGHGTHVAGTAGGATYGAAKSVTLVAVRVLNCSGSGTTSGVISGINWVTGDHAAGEPAVANMSLGGGASSALDTAVNNSINDGVTYAVAAGNSNANACNYSPSRVAAAITVGSTTASDSRSSFSNWGICLDIFAPGSSITSAWHTSDTATNTISGTSMATPHVAGVAALYLESDPGALPVAVWSAIRDASTPDKVTNRGTGSPNRLLFSLFSEPPPPPTQLLQNPGFESGEVAWSATPFVVDSSGGRPARTGLWKAWLDGYGETHTDVLFQDVAIPPGVTSAMLSFWVRIDTSETTTTTPFDTLQVQIRDTTDGVLETLAAYSNLDANSVYVQKSFNVAAYRGQTIRVYFLGEEDFSLQTSFVIDDTALDVQ